MFTGVVNKQSEEGGDIGIVDIKGDGMGTLHAKVMGW